ncbi:MAG: DUF3131 domain-containing protein [Candidatus Bathyarchaeia archaeon]|jgi:hypothetical protein
MTQTSKDKIGLHRRVRLANLAALTVADDKKASGKQSRLRFGRKTKILAATAIIAVILISFVVSLSYENPQLCRWLGADVPPAQTGAVLISSSQPFNSSVWLSVAANAWAYFQPGVGVDPNTGLPYAGGSSFKAFTAWDLGVYIQAVIDAQELGLVNSSGTWGSSERLEKVIDFLETRPLNATTGYPFWFYSATNGQDYSSLSNQATGIVDVADTGRLFVALNNLRNFNASLSSSIDYIVYNESDYAALIPSVESNVSSNDVYNVYIDSGFASFWPQQVGNVPDAIMNNIDKTENVTTYGVSLPATAITCEPLLCAIFELNSSNPQLNALMKQVYLAHVANYEATGKYVAFSEGNSFTSTYIYEWVVGPDGGTWKITSAQASGYLNIEPLIYIKVAFSFMALYNSTYALKLILYLQKTLPTPTHGYYDGADNSGEYIPGGGSGTNGLILDAALYATQHSAN